MKIRLYMDEDSMDKALVNALHGRGVDVTTALEEEMIERPDDEHLAFAAEQGRALYSFNVSDFYELHTSWLEDGRSHSGIILARQQQYSVGQQLRRLLNLIGTLTAAEMKDRVEFLSHWKAD